MLKWLLIVVLLVGGGGFVAMKYVAPRFKPKAPEWKQETIARGDLLITVTAAGTINPLRTVAIGSQVSGKVKDVYKVANDTVKTGEVMAKMETDLLEADQRSAEVRASQARAALAQLRVERENLKIRRERHTANIERKRITVERSQGTLELAVKNLNRYQDLLKVDATSLTEVDIRILEEANAKRDLQLQKIELQQTAVDLQQIDADQKALDARELQSQADIQQAEASLERAKTNLSYATILSPIDGVVLEHLIEPGQTVAASFQTPNLFRVATDLADMRIDAKLDEADIGRIRVGQEVTFDVDAYRNETFNGTVAIVRLQSEARTNLVNYPVLVYAKNPVANPGEAIVDKIPKDVLKALGVTPVNHGWKLLPGMTASLKFVVDARKNIPLLPAAALRFIPPQGFAPDVKKNVATTNNDKKTGTKGSVFVVNALGLLESRAVVVGETDGDFFELLEGDVKEGDSIVVGTKL